MIEVFASQPHYVDHLAPIVVGLGDDAELIVLTDDLVAYARASGITRARRGAPRQADGPPVLVAGYRDAAWTSTARRLALIEHGVGQTYADVSHMAYAGGPGWERLSLYLSPGPWATAKWHAGYPGLRVVECGVPKLDQWFLGGAVHGAVDRPRDAPVTVAVTFHWPCKETVETWPAFDDWADEIAALAGDTTYRLVGHWHPRWATVGRNRLDRFYARHGIPVVDVETVLGSTDVLVADNTSLLYEFAALDKPVVCLNAARWRADVEHGLRFWDLAPGIQGWPGAHPLVGMVDAADELACRAQRRDALAAAYGATLDGYATDRAVAALREWAQ